MVLHPLRCAGDFFVLTPSSDRCTAGKIYRFQVQLFNGNLAANEISEKHIGWSGWNDPFLDILMDRLVSTKSRQIAIPSILNYFLFGINRGRDFDHNFSESFSEAAPPVCGSGKLREES